MWRHTRQVPNSLLSEDTSVTGALSEGEAGVELDAELVAWVPVVVAKGGEVTVMPTADATGAARSGDVASAETAASGVACSSEAFSGCSGTAAAAVAAGCAS